MHLKTFLKLLIFGVFKKTTKMENILRPHHFAITVSNYVETINWYQQKLGFKTESEFERKDLGSKIAFLSLNGIFLEIFYFQDSQDLPEYRKSLISDLKVQGLKHFAFVVKDIKAKVLELKALGVEFVLEPTLGGAGHFYAFFKDNNGTLLELFEESSFNSK